MRPFSWLRPLLGWNRCPPHTRSVATRRQPLRRQPCLEPLEDRWVPAATFTVTTLKDGVGVPGMTLREAIQAADTTAAADTIVFKTGLGGTIKLTGGELGILQPLVLAGPGASKIALDGNAADRIFRVDNGNNATPIKVTIQGLRLFNGKESLGGAIASAENLTVKNCVITGNRAADNGGGIHQELGTLTLRRSTVSGNISGQSGGGLYASPTAAGLVIDQSTIRANRAGLYGGGLFTNAALTTITGSKITSNTAQNTAGGLGTNSAMVIDRSTISGNVSQTGHAGGLSQLGGSLRLTNSTVSGNRAAKDGGGLLVGNTASAIIRGCTIAGNTAKDGGGINHSGGSLTLTNSTVRENRAEFGGGGVRITRTTAPSMIRGCTIADNVAERGGGLVGFNTGAVFIQNSTISGNRAVTFGGGLLVDQTETDRPWVIQNCTIAFNRSENQGGGIWLFNADATLESTIVANNSAPLGGGLDLFSFGAGDQFTVNFSLIGSSLRAGEVNATLDLTSSILLERNPRLAPLASHGGPTQTHALKKGSPCINQGSNPAHLTTDQRGGLFKRKLGSGVDIGAYERE